MSAAAAGATTKLVGAAVSLLVLGGVITLVGRRVADPLERRASFDELDEIDTSDEPLWVDLPL